MSTANATVSAHSVGHGPAAGSTVVTLTGAEFLDTSELSCALGDRLVPATYL